MTKATRNLAKKDWKSVLFVLIFAIAALAPAMFRGVPVSRDLQNHFRFALAVHDDFSLRDFYPGWLAEANGGYGDVSLRFYPPGLSVALAVVQTLTSNWYTTALLVFTLLTFVGGLGVYTWARSFLEPEAARWAAALFIFMPYRINELYQSSLLAEYAAAAVLPFVFAFTERLCRDGGRRNIAGLAASYALLILTNLPMTVIGSYALVVYLLLRMDWNKLFPTVWKFAAALALGVGAGACYWVTVLAELSWLRPDNETAFSRVNFIFASFRPQQGDTSIWYGNLIVLATIAITLPALILFRRGEDSSQRSVWRRLGAFAIFSLFMSTIISFPLWEILPKLKQVQLPWRWLAVTSSTCAVLVAASIDSWKEVAKSNRRPLALLAAGAVLMSLAFTISHPIREATYLSESRFNNVIATVRGIGTIGAWYPKWVAEKFLVLPQQIVAGERAVTVTAWESEHRAFQVAAGPATEARVHTFYYPLWSASAAGNSLPTRPDQDGTLIITLPAEAVSVDLSLREPPRSKISGIVSLLAAVLIALLATVPRRRKSNHSDKLRTDR
jgi:hypothetical protein